MKEFWNSRYSNDDFAYGVQPNVFYKEQLAPLTPGKILFPAEGEGRNAVYAAGIGWKVFAFDYSEVAKSKALQLCKQKNVSIDYTVNTIEDSNYAENSFDVLALIFAHNPNRSKNHQHLLRFLKPGGMVILEAFSKEQIHYNTGGPKNIEMLYSIAELQDDFRELKDLKIWIEEVELDEGQFHKGKASVIRLTGIK